MERAMRVTTIYQPPTTGLLRIAHQAHGNQRGPAAGHGRPAIPVAVAARIAGGDVHNVGVNNVAGAGARLIYEELHKADHRLLSAAVPRADAVTVVDRHGYERRGLGDSDRTRWVVGVVAASSNRKRRRNVVVHRVLALRPVNKIVDALLGWAHLVAGDEIHRTPAGERCFRGAGFDFSAVNLAAAVVAGEADVVILAGKCVAVQYPRLPNCAPGPTIPPGWVCDLAVLNQVALALARGISRRLLVCIAVGHQPGLDATGAEGNV